MTQKQVKNKLTSINTPGALMMLFDFLSETDHFGKPLKECVEQEEIAKQVASIAARLKVRYMSEITPVQDSRQKSILELIDEVNNEKKEKKSKKKRISYKTINL